MAFDARDVKDRAIQHPGRYQLVPVAGTTDQFDLVAVPGVVTDAGTAINKAYLQPIEDALDEATTTIEGNTAAVTAARLNMYKNIGGAL